MAGDHVAVVGENRKLLVFPLAELPEMGRGKGVRLQRYKDGGLSDAVDLRPRRRADLEGPGRAAPAPSTDLAEWTGDARDRRPHGAARLPAGQPLRRLTASLRPRYAGIKLAARRWPQANASGGAARGHVVEHGVDELRLLAVGIEGLRHVDVLGDRDLRRRVGGHELGAGGAEERAQRRVDAVDRPARHQRAVGHLVDARLLGHRGRQQRPEMLEVGLGEGRAVDLGAEAVRLELLEHRLQAASAASIWNSACTA